MTAAIDPESVDCDLRNFQVDLRNVPANLQQPHFGGGGSKPVFGEVKKGTFILRKRITYRNSFPTFATGTLRPTKLGTLIEGKFSAHPKLRSGYRAWGCLMLVIGGPIVFYLLSNLISGALQHWQGLWAPPYQAETSALRGLMAPAVIFAICRLVAIGDDRFLWQFLVRTLEARTA